MVNITKIYRFFTIWRLYTYVCTGKVLVVVFLCFFSGEVTSFSLQVKDLCKGELDSYNTVVYGSYTRTTNCKI